MQAWLAFLTAHSRLVPLVSRDLETACGISLVWYDVLFQLTFAPREQRRMTDLARAVLLSKSGLTRLVDNIEEAGLVRRATIPGDRRSVHIRLTPAGRRLVKRAIPVVRRSVKEQFGKHLSDMELAVIRDALSRVADSTRAVTSMDMSDAPRPESARSITRNAAMTPAAGNARRQGGAMNAQ
jgi:DNA-binding MarR family transcriptional regulator